MYIRAGTNPDPWTMIEDNVPTRKATGTKALCQHGFKNIGTANLTLFELKNTVRFTNELAAAGQVGSANFGKRNAGRPEMDEFMLRISCSEKLPLSEEIS
jgi:hypothetical protein